MTNAPDFNLRDALDATRAWDDDTIELDDELLEDAPFDELGESGYADDGGYDDADPEELTVGAQELAERHALRRVASLRTELEDITEVEYRQLRLEKVVLVGVWTGGTVDRRRELDGRARAPRRDRRLRGAGGRLPAPPVARPGDLHRPRQGRGDPRDRPGHRRRHRDLRRRARAEPAAQPRGQDQGQGRRPHRADPRHLRPAREVQGGPGAGRARPAAVHEAAPARLGRQPVPAGRWPCRRR